MVSESPLTRFSVIADRFCLGWAWVEYVPSMYNGEDRKITGSRWALRIERMRGHSQTMVGRQLEDAQPSISKQHLEASTKHHRAFSPYEQFCPPFFAPLLQRSPSYRTDHLTPQIISRSPMVECRKGEPARDIASAPQAAQFVAEKRKAEYAHHGKRGSTRECLLNVPALLFRI